MSPTRIQRRRTKGWRRPDNCVIVTRPSRYGNPFTLGGAKEWLGAKTNEEAREACAMAFRSWIRGRDTYWMGPAAEATRKRLVEALPALRGKDLACYCPLPEPGQPDHCHAAVLLLASNDYGAPAGAGVCDRCWTWEASPASHLLCPTCGGEWSRIVEADR